MRTEHGAWSSTFRATLPRISRRSPVWPRLPTTMRPASSRSQGAGDDLVGGIALADLADGGEARLTQPSGSLLVLGQPRQSLDLHQFGVAGHRVRVEQRRDGRGVREPVLGHGHDRDRQPGEERPRRHHALGGARVRGSVVGEDDRSDWSSRATSTGHGEWSTTSAETDRGAWPPSDPCPDDRRRRGRRPSRAPGRRSPSRRDPGSGPAG